MPNHITITINDQAKLTEMLNQLGLKPAANAIALFAASINHFGVCTISVAHTLGIIPPSYKAVPANMSRYLMTRTSAKYIRAKNEEAQFTVTASNIALPSSFKSQILQALQVSRRFCRDRDEVPSSYRCNPRQLASIVENILDEKVHVTVRAKTITWKLGRKQEND